MYKKRKVSAAAGAPAEEEDDNTIDISIEPVYPTPSKSSAGDVNFIKSITPTAKQQSVAMPKSADPPAAAAARKPVPLIRKKLQVDKSKTSPKKTISQLKLNLVATPSCAYSTVSSAGECIVCKNMCTTGFASCYLGCGKACHISCGNFGGVDGFVCEDCSRQTTSLEERSC